MKNTIKRVVWSKDEAGKWNGLVLRGREEKVNSSAELEILRVQDLGHTEIHVTDGFNKIDNF